MALPYPSAVCLYFSLFLVACNAQSTYLLTETRHPASADALALFLWHIQMRGPSAGTPLGLINLALPLTLPQWRC